MRENVSESHGITQKESTETHTNLRNRPLAELPPEMLAHLYVVKAERLMGEKDYVAHATR